MGKLFLTSGRFRCTGTGAGRLAEARIGLASLSQVRSSVMPQVVPARLVAESRREGRPMAALPLLGDLAVAFVVDEEQHYTFIQRRQMRRWQVRETDLLRLALGNLQDASRTIKLPLRIGRGSRLTLVWDAFDGYDASRILLNRLLSEAALQVAGDPVIAIPHRDHMVMFGDSAPDFVEEMAERVQEESANHPYPVSAALYTLQSGLLAAYDRGAGRRRYVN